MNALKITQHLFMPHRVARRVVLFALVLSMSTAAVTVRIKDISRLETVRENQLIGYGLVVGLSGTGDGSSSKATLQGISNMLANFGVQVDPEKLNANNVAAVMVTTKIGPFNVTGDPLDVEVSSIARAKSLRGGVLLMTPLKGANGHVYAVAQGAISLGGFSVDSRGSQQLKNHATSGRIPNGASVERSIQTPLSQADVLTWVLDQDDFGTVDNIHQAIVRKMGDIPVKVINGSRFQVSVPERYRSDVVGLIAKIDDLEVETKELAKIVLSEKTGSIVMGGPIRIAPVVVAYEGLNVSIRNVDEVVQPNSFSQGQTALVQGSIINVEHQSVSAKNEAFKTMSAETTIQDLVRVLNGLNVGPQNTITILQLMKEAGAIKAKMEII
jgi:flagellar P-ring protein precursor FlgI